MGLNDLTFYDVICANAETYGQHTAWLEVDDNRKFGFEDYRNQVNRLAAGLQQQGVGKAERIAVVGKNSWEYFLLYGAAAALGAIVLPVNWRLSTAEMLFNINDVAPTLVFVDPDYQEQINGIRDQLRGPEQLYSLGSGGSGFTPFADLLREAGEFERHDVSWNDGLVIIHTAAVHGRPRGAILSHKNLLCANVHLAALFNISAQDVHLNLLPLFHVAGLFMATQAFHAGATNINMSRFDADKAVALIAQEKVSLMFDFAPILGAILDAHAKSDADISSLRAVLGLEAPQTIEKYQAVSGGTFYCMYGQTETSALATLGAYDACPGSAGRPIALAQVRLFNDKDQPVPKGDIGEIVMRGPLVFNGYWNLPEDNAHTFRNGWHHTGDLGRFDKEGYLWYEGRKADKELIKPGGENVYPSEVEAAILAHPAVTAAVVFGVPDPKWKEGIKAVCQLEPEAELSPQALIAFVAERIASYKKPQYVEFVSQMPLNDAGETDREAVKQRYGGPQQVD